MSATGTGIFNDDVACDIRAQFRRLLAEGTAPAAATRMVLWEWKPALADDEDGPVIWLALAATQCQYGCLEPRVKAKALAIIDDGSDLIHWRSTGNPGYVRRRIAVLARLRAKLESPPAARARIPAQPKQRRAPVEEKSVWPRGEVIAYRLLSERYILMHVCDYLGCDRTGWAPMFAVLDWRGKRVPPAERIQLLPYKIRTDDPVEKRSVFVVSVGRARESELPQERVVRRVAMRPVAAWKQLVGAWGGCSCSRWRDLDQHLQQYLGWQ
jgi:hypothetical protein